MKRLNISKSRTYYSEDKGTLFRFFSETYQLTMQKFTGKDESATSYRVFNRKSFLLFSLSPNNKHHPQPYYIQPSTWRIANSQVPFPHIHLQETHSDCRRAAMSQNGPQRRLPGSRRVQEERAVNIALGIEQGPSLNLLIEGNRATAPQQRAGNLDHPLLVGLWVPDAVVCLLRHSLHEPVFNTIHFIPATEKGGHLLTWAKGRDPGTYRRPTPAEERGLIGRYIYSVREGTVTAEETADTAARLHWSIPQLEVRYPPRSGESAATFSH